MPSTERSCQFSWTAKQSEWTLSSRPREALGSGGLLGCKLVAVVVQNTGLFWKFRNLYSICALQVVWVLHEVRIRGSGKKDLKAVSQKY